MNKLKQMRIRYSEQKGELIEAIEEQEEILARMAETINFYSAEFYPTVEVQCFFENLIQHYNEIYKSREEIFNKLTSEKYLCLNQDKCSNRYLSLLNKSDKGERNE